MLNMVETERRPYPPLNWQAMAKYQNNAWLLCSENSPCFAVSLSEMVLFVSHSMSVGGIRMIDINMDNVIIFKL